MILYPFNSICRLSNVSVVFVQGGDRFPVLRPAETSCHYCSGNITAQRKQKYPKQWAPESNNILPSCFFKELSTPHMLSVKRELQEK